MKTLQSENNKKNLKPLIEGFKLFFAHLLRTFKNFKRYRGPALTQGRFCIFSPKGQSAMEYIIIIFVIIGIAAIGSHEFVARTRASGNMIFQKSLERMSITGLQVSSDRYLGIPGCGFGVNYSDEVGVPSTTYDDWLSTGRGTISCVNYARWFPGLSYTGSSSTATWFDLKAPDGRTGTVCLTIISKPECAPSSVPTLPEKETQAEQTMY